MTRGAMRIGRLIAGHPGAMHTRRATRATSSGSLLGVELVVALVAGIAAFTIGAVALDPVESAILVAGMGVLFAVVLTVIARSLGSVYAVPVGMGGILATDWFYVPPTHPLKVPDSGNLVELLVVLGLGVLLGDLADRSARRAEAAERARGLVADEQAALRRVATLVATGAAPERVFTGVAQDVGLLFQVHGVRIARYDGDELVHVAEWVAPGRRTPRPYGRAALEPASVSAAVLAGGRGARIDDYERVADKASYAEGVPLSSAVGIPVVVEDRTWGLIIAWSETEALARNTEERLGQFAELVGTAIANAQARQELRGVAAEQSALHRVAALVARAAQPEEVFESVAREAGRLVRAHGTVLGRYEGEGTYVVVGGCRARSANEHWSLGTRVPVSADRVARLVHETGRPARIDDDWTAGSVSEVVWGRGVRAAVGIPISVGGTVWGVLIAVFQEGPPAAETEARLIGFAELMATAISNAESQAALRASRARLVTAADTARRRIERDLHDGAQQRLVSTALRLRSSVRDAVPPGADRVVAHLDAIATELDEVLAGLREIARGIHPAILAEGGLRPALNALARRSVLPVSVEVLVEKRLPEEVELGAYYVVSEALTNAAKHSGATNVDVMAKIDDGELTLVVEDDGCGGALSSGGSGLIGLADRAEALGGRATVVSPLGRGTKISVRVPVSGPDRPPMGTDRCEGPWRSGRAAAAPVNPVASCS
jgi:signal transduction histidine kinase